MIRSSGSKTPVSPKVNPRRETNAEEAGSKFGTARSIWSITKPARWCKHGDGATCKECNLKVTALIWPNTFS